MSGATTFGIIRLADVWVITARGKRWGRFLYRVDAEEAALRLAAQAAAAGEAIEVLVQERGGELRPMEVA